MKKLHKNLLLGLCPCVTLVKKRVKMETVVKRDYSDTCHRLRLGDAKGFKGGLSYCKKEFIFICRPKKNLRISF